MTLNRLDFVERIKSSGFSCHFDSARSRYILSEVSHDGISSGISFALECVAGTWVIRLWSGACYAIADQGDIALLATTILSGSVTHSHRTPSELPLGFIEESRLAACRQYCITASCDHEFMIEIPFDLPELQLTSADLTASASQIANNSRVCESSDRLIFSVGNIECRIGVGDADFNRCVLSMILLGDASDEECHEIVRHLQRTLPVVAFGEDGHRC